MYTVRVEASFSAAHFLSQYRGKCENLHGHNYLVHAWAKGETLGEGGMLVDFGILKKALGEICGSLDHINLNDMEVFQNNPSAERIARFIFENVKEKLNELHVDNAALWAVDVYETPTSMARYEQ